MEHSQSPQKISPEGDLLSHEYLPPLSADSLHQELILSYAAYRQNKVQSTCFKKVTKTLSNFATHTLGFLHQLWRQIIPEVVRGPMPIFSPPISWEGQQKELLFFQEFVKKKAPFFLIVYKSDCPEQEIQEAYIYATNIVSEGISLKHEQLENQTAYQHWAMRNDGPPQKYSIYVLQFDVFHKMLWFGTLTKSLLLASADRNRLAEHFCMEVRTALKAYQKLEDDFLGSYVEKEDRFALDPVDDK